MESKGYCQKTLIFSLILIFCFVAVYSQSTKDVQILFSRGQYLEEVKGDLEEAIKVYQQVLELYPEERNFAARALLRIGECYRKMGNQDAQQAFERIVQEFADQSEIAAEAQTRLQVLKKPMRLFADEGMLNRQVWADSQTDPSGSISPDGRYLSFVDWFKGDLYVRDLTTGINRNLTKNPDGSLDFANFAKWSPDGTKIAYLWFYGPARDLRVIGKDGPEPSVIFHSKDVRGISLGGWSPDSRYISVYLEDKAKSDQSIALISAESGNVRILKSGKSKSVEMGPFSPDGRFIVYDHPQQEGSLKRDVFLLASDGSSEFPLIEHPADDRFLGWSSDGNWLLYLSDRSGTLDAWTIQVESGRPKGDPQLIKPGIGDILPLGLTNEGVFYYGLDSRNRDPYIVDFDPIALKLVSEPKRVNQRFIGYGHSLDWSPDGKYLAYISTRQSLPMHVSSPAIVLQTLETGTEHELSLEGSLETPLAFPHWFPDSRALLVWGNDLNRNKGFYRIDIETEDVELLFHSKPGERFMWPMLSPDGSVVYYQSITRQDNLTRIVKKTVETGEEKVLYSVLRPARFSAPALSPDGRKIVFQLIDKDASDYTDILKILPTEGGEPEDLMREQMPKGKNIAGGGLAWTPDGSHIIFSRGKGDKEGTAELWILPAAGGVSKRLGLSIIGTRALRVRPDGKQIGFLAGRWISEIWVLENFLPKK